MCMCIVWKGRPRNDLYCVGRDVKPYSPNHFLVSRYQTAWPPPHHHHHVLGHYYSHQFPRPRCCSTSLSLPVFKNLVWGNLMECACSFFSMSLDEVMLVSQKTPIRTSEWGNWACRLTCPISSFEKLEHHPGQGKWCVWPRHYVWCIYLQASVSKPPPLFDSDSDEDNDWFS